MTIIFSLLRVIILVLGIIGAFLYNGKIKVHLQIKFFIVHMIIFKNTLTIIEGCANVIQIEFRLKLISEKLQIFCSSTKSLDALDYIESDKIPFRSYYYDKKKYRTTVKSAKNLVSSQYSNFHCFNRCYLLLTEQNTFINKGFGVRVSVHNNQTSNLN